jgi:hypothetical protein
METLVFLNRNLFAGIKDTGVGSCNVSYVLLRKDSEYSVAHVDVKDRWNNTASSTALREQVKKQFDKHVFVGSGVVEIQKRDSYPGPSNLVLRQPEGSSEKGDMDIETILNAAKHFSNAAKETWGFNPPITIKEYCFN